MMEIKDDGTVKMTDPLHYGQSWNSMKFRYEKDKELHRLNFTGNDEVDGLSALFEFLPDDTLHIDFSRDRPDAFTDEDSFLTRSPRSADTNSFIGVWSDKRGNHAEVRFGLWPGGKGLIAGEGITQIIRWKLSGGNRAEIQPIDSDPEIVNLYSWTLSRIVPTDQAILVKTDDVTKLFARESEEKLPYSYYETAVEISRRIESVRTELQSRRSENRAAALKNGEVFDEGVKVGSREFALVLRDGAKGKYSFRVIDDDGAPVSEAHCKVSFAMATSKWISGMSDVNGVFSASGKSRGEMLYRISKGGYYQTNRRMTFGRHDGVVVRDGKWQPWNPEIPVVLRKVLAPIPMHARIVDTMIPAGKIGFGFDLEVGDWTQPAGEGLVSDLVFNIEGFWRSYRDNDSTLAVTFSNDSDGMNGVDNGAMSTGSDFLMPRYAPEEDYQGAWSWRRSRKQKKGASKDSIVDDLVGGGDYVFRVRSETNALGAVTNALYGKIRGNVEFAGAASGAEGSWIRFTYYLNPTPNDRNLEFDPKQNLFKNLTSLERVNRP
jgi:hypothetical protein